MIQVNQIRTQQKYIKERPDRIAELNAIGFTAERVNPLHDVDHRFEAIYTALVTYRTLYGDVDVPQHFVVPAIAPWPEVTWGVKLGIRVASIRSQSTFVSNSPDRR